MECDEVRELIEAHALGALGGAEESAVRLHLATCPSCRRLARSYEQVVAGLPQALAVASPLRVHPSVKDQVLARLDAPRQASVRRFQPWRVVALIAALLLGVALVWGYRVNQELVHQRAVNAELLGKIHSRDEMTVFEVVDSPTTTKLSLRSTTGSSAYGKIFTKADSQDVVVMVNRLPQPQPGQSYQLWLTNDSSTRLAGRLDVDSDGFAYIVYHADRKGPMFQSAVVTEQAPGGTAPGSVAFLSWQKSPTS